MPFIEEQQETNISYPSNFGGGFDVQVVDTMVNRYTSLRHPYKRDRFRINFTNKTIPQQVEYVIDLFNRCGGMAGGFRLYSKANFSTHNYTEEPAVTDQLCEEIDAGEKTYQLMQWYGAPSATTPRRKIKKPIAGTVVASIFDGSVFTPTTAFTVDTTTGIITLDSALGMGEFLYAGCYFDYPVAFASNLDGIALTAGRVLSSSIDLVELLNPEDVV